MIQLERKVELLTKHAKALEAFKELADIEYAKRLNMIALDALVDSHHISEEERQWLIEQLNDQELSEEEIELKEATKLLHEITHLYIRIDTVFAPSLNLSFRPNFEGTFYNNDNGDILFDFDSFEDCVKKMQIFLKDHERF